jgi:LacI family transcriptional regulator
MGKRVTLTDIARASKVSVSTVSLVLRNKPGIPAETREQVLRAARELGYRPRNGPLPNVVPARAGTLHTVGVLLKSDADVGAHANPFYSYVVAGIEDACRRKHINLLYATLPVDEHNVISEPPRLLLDEAADGLLLVGAFVDDALHGLLREKGLPAVLVDAYPSWDRYDSVVSDNVHGAYQAVRHLIAQGHRHIGLVGARADAYPSIRERREGYLRALRDHGIAPAYYADCAPNVVAAAAAATALLRDHPQVTALFGCNDEVALAALRSGQALGRRVPDDLSVAGFDDIDLAQVVTPALTTMHVDKVTMGRVAVQLLTMRVETPEAARLTTALSPRLVERASVAPPPPP